MKGGGKGEMLKASELTGGGTQAKVMGSELWRVREEEEGRKAGCQPQKGRRKANSSPPGGRGEVGPGRRKPGRLLLG